METWGDMPCIGYAGGMEDASLCVLSPRPKKGEVVQYVGKRFFLGEDGRVADEQRHYTFYQPSLALYDSADIRSLARALSGVIAGDFGPAFLVRGCPTNSKSTTRREAGKLGRDGKLLPGIRDEPSRHILLDLDELPNPEGYDPRVQWVEDAATWALSLLPPSIRGAGWVVFASSSCCVKDEDKRPLPPGQPPPKLRLHLHGILSEEVGRDALRAALRALDGHLRSTLLERYGISAARVLDESTAIPNQAAFVSPTFGQGLSDPFEGVPRMWVRDGGQVDLDSVLAECVPPPPAPEKLVRVAVARPPKAHEPRALSAEERLAYWQARNERTVRELERVRAEARPVPEKGRRGQDYKLWCQMVLADLHSLMGARISAGVWPDSGMPEGAGRNLLLLKVAALARASGRSTDEARREVMDFARFWMQGGEDFGRGFLARNPWAFARFARPGRAGIIGSLGIGEDEIEALGLESLRSKAARVAARRAALRAKGLTARGKERKRREGDGAAEEAAAMGISRATLLRRRSRERRAQMVAEAALT